LSLIFWAVGRNGNRESSRLTAGLPSLKFFGWRRPPRVLLAARGLFRVARLAQTLEIVAIPKARGIAAVRSNVIDLGGECDHADALTVDTQRARVEHRGAELLPAYGVVPPSYGDVRSFPFFVPEVHTTPSAPLRVVRTTGHATTGAR
jgi:hypothetical protein